jgi:AcrR family transcriptional regulator
VNSPKRIRKHSPRDTLAAIVAAASHEFGKNGLGGARMENIAKRCGKTKQLIYHYYGSKELLFADIVWKSFQQSIANMLSDDYDSLHPEEAVERFLFNMSEQYRLFPDWVPIMLDENIHGGIHFTDQAKARAIQQPVIQTFARILQRGVAEKTFASDIDPDKLFAAAWSMVTACFLNGSVLSTFLSVDMKTKEGQDAWRQFTIGLVLTMIKHPGASPLKVH